MLDVAKAEAPVVSRDASLSLLQNDGQVSQVASKPVDFFTPASGEAVGVAAPQVSAASFAPVQSFDPVRSYSVIPEPTTAALLVGLGVLVGVKRLKIGRRN